MKNKFLKRLGISICISSMILGSSIMVSANNKILEVKPIASGTTSVLPEAGSSVSTYAPISGDINSSNYNKEIEISVDNFSNGMESVNMGLYVDGVFQASEHSITSDGSATFTFPGSGKGYEIRMSTYSSTPGTCKYSTSII